MSRRRPPEADYICRRCGCACNAAGTRHVGGGPGMRACRLAPDPVLRRDAEAEARQVAQAITRGRPTQEGPRP